MAKALRQGFLAVFFTGAGLLAVTSWADPVPAGAPTPAASDLPVLRVAVISDLNGPYGATYYNREVHSAMDRIVALRPDLVLTTGDMISAERATLTDENVAQMWTAFHETVSNPLERAGIPFAVTPGNHDASVWSAFTRDRRVFVENWMPRKPQVHFVDDSNYPLRYAFTSGPALFISLDATRGDPLDAAQKAWVKTVLDANPSYPVKILYGHVPLYPFAIQREEDYLKDPAFERFLVERGVTMYLSGHHHAYYPGKRGSLRLVGTSCIGDGARRWIGTDRVSPKGFLWIEIDSHGIKSLENYAAPDFTSVVPRSSLPGHIGEAELRIDRDDL